MTRKDLKQQLEQTINEIEHANAELRAQHKLNKAKKIRINDKLTSSKDRLIGQHENIFQSAFLGGSALLASVLSAVFGGATLAGLLISVGFGCLGLGCGAIMLVAYKKKVKIEKEILNLENELNSLPENSEEIENLEQRIKILSGKQANLINKLEKLEEKANRSKQKIDILKAVEESNNTNRYVSDEFDASEETLLNYQKSLQKKRDEELKK